MNTTNDKLNEGSGSNPHANHSQQALLAHCENRRLSTESVLNQLRAKSSQLYELAEVVGQWVWLDVSPARKPGLAKLLWSLGFHRNQRRGVWIYLCIKLCIRWGEMLVK